MAAKTVLFLCSFFIGFSLLWMGGMNMNALENENKNEKKKNIFLMTDGPETQISVKTIGKFFIKIKSNPSTGYSWSLQKITDEGMVTFKSQEIEEEEEEEKESISPRLGAATFEIFTFEALKPGKTKVLLKYHRPWEKDVPPLKTHTLQITIQ
jgi:inhibitor of cysteine peptidase